MFKLSLRGVYDSDVLRVLNLFASMVAPGLQFKWSAPLIATSIIDNLNGTIKRF